jgi:ribosomal protein L15E
MRLVMIKTNTPAIDVDELKQKICQEVAEHRRYRKDENSVSTAKEIKMAVLM